MSAPFTSVPPDALKQKKYVVAFLDFLGASEKMRSPEESDKFLQKIYTIYHRVIDAMDEAPDHGKPKLDIRIFSDNILFAKKFEAQKPLFEEWQYVSRWASVFQALALRHELPIRGAITFGDFYIDETFVYGDALVRAHEMEARRAIYPRIIVDEAFFRDTIFTGVVGFMKNITFSLDSDGEFFLDFISPLVLGNNPKGTRENYVSIRTAIIKLFHRHKGRPELKQKYCWLVYKFNELIKNRVVDDRHKIVLDANNEPDLSVIYEDETRGQHE